MAATKEDVRDFEIVINEAFRLRELLNESYKLYEADFENKFDSMASTINIPRDILDRNKNEHNFQIHLSSLAQKKIFEITSRQIKRNKWNYHLTVNEHIVDIKDSLYIHVMQEKEFDLRGCTLLLSRAYKRAKYKMKEISYFLPINASGISKNNDIKIGPVKITHKDNIYEKLDDKERLESFTKNDHSSEYSGFLCIDIPTCSEESSKKRAQSVADFIFGVIKVFSVAYQVNTKQLSLNKNPSENRINHHIERTEGKFYVCGSVEYSRNFGEFWAALNDDLNSDLGVIIDKLTKCSIVPEEKNNLSDRLIDAFIWFGDASRDNNEHSQVVKLVTAMERLVTLSLEKKDKNLTQRFVSRVSSSIAIFHGDLNKWKLEAKEIYNLRSNLVHGSQSLYKTYDIPIDFYPFRLACFSILSSCIYFDQLGLNSINYEEKLKIMYRNIEEHCAYEKYKKPIPLH
ncbi:HEPN domain-containing protein [Vibrio parahaemolyticus]|uniref:HEPN domain-containing protein n=1 Tax=Vibrio parahaemolyticus TaxID=670 RepID=UPI0011224800|nr:HEPN domain-containing protein [Vibrio parahaemolyticus]TOP96753.1 hypothetical protein CGH07_00410 [Vibrio parahaemolyticus]HCG9637556.1 hypothetical protein [Vibrio parahaemolyticus]